jgi:cytochrome c5
MLKKFLITLSLGVVYFATMADSREEVQARIKPVGQVQLEGDESAKAREPTTTLGDSKPKKEVSEGEKIYQQFCVTCHATGVAGAPKIHDKAGWAPRLKHGKAHLLKHAISGINAMPPKGTCMTCSDEQIKAAINFMLPK